MIHNQIHRYGQVIHKHLESWKLGEVCLLCCLYGDGVDDIEKNIDVMMVMKVVGSLLISHVNNVGKS